MVACSVSLYWAHCPVQFPYSWFLPRIPWTFVWRLYREIVPWRLIPLSTPGSWSKWWIPALIRLVKYFLIFRYPAQLPRQCNSGMKGNYMPVLTWRLLMQGNFYEAWGITRAGLPPVLWERCLKVPLSPAGSGGVLGILWWQLFKGLAEAVIL